VSSLPCHQSRASMKSRLAAVFVFFLCSQIAPLAQIPNINMGPDSTFAQIDFAQMSLDQMNRRMAKSEQKRKQEKEMIDSGVISALDLEAPNKAVEEFNQATTLMRAQHSQEAIKHMRLRSMPIPSLFQRISASDSHILIRRTSLTPKASLKWLRSSTRSFPDPS